MLTNNEFYFPSPLSFNDPYDCTIPILYMSGASKPEVMEYFRRAAENDVEFQPGPEATRRAFRNLSRRIPNDLSTAQLRDIQRTRKEAAKLGIQCLCGIEDNRLMWAHYANGHTGFAIGYRANVLYEAVLAGCSGAYGGRVEYEDAYPIIVPYQLKGDLDKWGQAYGVKHTHWEYEEEYRFIWPKGAKKTLILPPYVVDRVVVGMETSNRNIQRVISILRARGDEVSLFRAKRIFLSYEIKFERLEF